MNKNNPMQPQQKQLTDNDLDVISYLKKNLKLDEYHSYMFVRGNFTEEGKETIADVFCMLASNDINFHSMFKSLLLENESIRRKIFYAVLGYLISDKAERDNFYKALTEIVEKDKK